MRIIADTGLLVAYLNRRDTYHDWAAALIADADFPILTSEPVVTEAAWHLRDSQRLLELINNDILRPALNCRNEAEALLGLARRYASRGPDFCDLSVIRLSELFAKHVVATLDRKDFNIYRRFGQQTIPVACPI